MGLKIGKKFKEMTFNAGTKIREQASKGEEIGKKVGLGDTSRSTIIKAGNWLRNNSDAAEDLGNKIDKIATEASSAAKNKSEEFLEDIKETGEELGKKGKAEARDFKTKIEKKYNEFRRK